MIISIVARPFDETQLRWSAMERELYSLWQSVVKHERFIKGLLCVVYTDHKNNMFLSSMLDNRRIAKKVSNWALELQQFNLERNWIRGEANILGDAPSRAPVDTLMRWLPIPTGPVMDVVRRIYGGFEDLEKEIRKMGEPLGEWKPLGATPEIIAQDTLTRNLLWEEAESSGRDTPKFGLQLIELPDGLTDEFGPGEALLLAVAEEGYPRWPWFAPAQPLQVLPAAVRELPYPDAEEIRDLTNHPRRIERRKGHDMSSGGWIVHWARPTYFTDGVRRKTLQFTDSTFGEGYHSSKSAKDCAREAVWDYFRHCFEANRVQELSGLGPLTQIGEPGEMSYHGDGVKREFSVHSWEAGVDAFGVKEFNHDIETFLLPGEFCTNCEAMGHRGASCNLEVTRSC